uniref:Secreted protein n=1 Tax=Romanomermis culicivorax TaxID=13658 RepID=A0A915HNV8_ROMCU
MVLSTGLMVMTKASWGTAVLVVVATETVVAGIDVTVVDNSSAQAVIDEDAVVIVAVSNLVVVVSKPIGQARGNGALNSGWDGGLSSAIQC